MDLLLFPGNLSSANHLDPRLVRDLNVGDIVPDGPPGTAYFVVSRVEPPEVLVLHSTTHVPPSWRRALRARVDWAWSFHLSEVQQGSTRLHLRVRGRLSPWSLRLVYLAALVPADHVMAHGMLRGVAARASASKDQRLGLIEAHVP